MLLGMPARLDDKALMLRFKDGDSAAFDTLYARHKGPLYRYLLRHVGDPETAADLFQDVWGKIIKSRERYRAVAKFTTYLYHVAHNCFIDYCRRDSRRPQSNSQEFDEETYAGDTTETRPDRETAREQLAACIGKALEGLPAEQREAFLLHEEGGLTLEQIGRVTGVGKETAKSRLRYAVAKLRRAVPQDFLQKTGT